MLRARLASLVMAGSLLLSTGCSTSFDFLRNHHHRGTCCPETSDCCDQVAGLPGCCPTPGCSCGAFPDSPLIANAHPPIVEGPNLFSHGAPAPFVGGPATYPTAPQTIIQNPGTYPMSTPQMIIQNPGTYPMPTPFPGPGQRMPTVPSNGVPPVVTVPQAIPTPSPP
jgi:hypothetical protein